MKDDKSRSGEFRQCIHCGKLIRRGLSQCPYCREAQTEVNVTKMHASSVGSAGNFRTGLLLVLLAGVIQYFSGGYSPPQLPPEFTSPALTYAVPLLAVGGAALILYAVFTKIRS
jgi:hypothetical protein